MKLLIVEDDRKMASTLKDGLKKDFAIDIAFNGEDASYLIKVNEYDVIILDYLLPDQHAPQLIKMIRGRKIFCPILVLTGQNTLNKTVECLDIGADDYVCKPAHLEEVKSRLRALLRRSFIPSNETIQIDDLLIDLKNKTVFRGDKKINLRRKEFDILEYFVRNIGKVLTRTMIYNHVWESSCESVPNTVYVHINHLRDHIDKPYSNKLIKTVHNIGYKFEGR